jgi:hypothetical protein
MHSEAVDEPKWHLQNEQRHDQPFSQTYPTMDRPFLVLGSCFFTAGFTRGASMLLTGSDLPLIQVQFGFVRPLH